MSAPKRASLSRGAHFNPVVSAADWWLGRRNGLGLAPGEVAAYAAAQVTGGVVGAVLANAMYDLRLVDWSSRDRTGGSLWLAEVVATTGPVSYTHLTLPTICSV